MSFMKRVNVIRRRITYYLTKNIGKSPDLKFVDADSKTEIKKILICRPNHRLGNLLLISPLLQEVITTFPKAKIDLLVQGGLAPVLYKNFDNVNKIIQLPKKPFSNLLIYLRRFISFKKRRYDLAINAVYTSSSGKLFTLFSNSKIKIYGEEKIESLTNEKDASHIAKHQVYYFKDYISKLGYKTIHQPIAPINLKLSPMEIDMGKKILRDLTKNNKKTIGLFTFATDDKCHSESWWLEFYSKIKNKYSNYEIVEILPVENVSQINFKAPSFYSKDIRQIAAFMANTEVFIGADSGIMHLASSAQIPVIGLFSRDNQNMYQPFGNHSIAVNTNDISIDGCIEILDKILLK